MAGSSSADARIACTWSTAMDCVNTSLSKRLAAATSLLESSDPWSSLASCSMHTRNSHVRSMLSTCSEVLQGGDEGAVADWFFLTASAFMSLHQSSSNTSCDSSAVLRILRKVGPYMTLLPVALGTSWLVLSQPEVDMMLEALETCVYGREYIWEGLLRAFNQTSNLGNGHVVALGHLLSLLLARDSVLIYPNDFQVFVDILVRETTDLDMDDPRRSTLATVLRWGVLSPLYERGGRYRSMELAIVVAQWKEALEKGHGSSIDRTPALPDLQECSTWKALRDAQLALLQQT
ncbi:hypothetical protein DYB26_015222 [Aphanomyces astaci]|uniref:SPIN90/Ldb17 leucine-rich domain-containing protein n=2 Tax=Aphanomyces astaci TaxID=112090 RepID=A0A397DQW8_APHAT|nr:hypothetical protein DYB38_001839 [Aphanomyces astaci]RHZ41059.1 hypothetical protein DYB26_015222 [Aphanomyces astaci]